MADGETFDLPPGFDTASIREIKEAALDAASMVMWRLTFEGLTDRQAWSLTAHVFLDAAWASAVIGALSENHEPVPQRFIDAATAATRRVDIGATRAAYAEVIADQAGDHA